MGIQEFARANPKLINITLVSSIWPVTSNANCPTINRATSCPHRQQLLHRVPWSQVNIPAAAKTHPGNSALANPCSTITTLRPSARCLPCLSLLVLELLRPVFTFLPLAQCHCMLHNCDVDSDRPSRSSNPNDHTCSSTSCAGRVLVIKSAGVVSPHVFLRGSFRLTAGPWVQSTPTSMFLTVSNPSLSLRYALCNTCIDMYTTGSSTP